MGWQFKPLREVCVIGPPKKEARKGLESNDLVSFVPMDSLGIGTRELVLDKEKLLSDVLGSYTYFAEGDVLLAKITPCFENGKLGIARGLKNKIGFGSSEFIVFRCTEFIDPDYLYYFLSADIFRAEGKSKMVGAVGHKRVPKDFIENHLIPVPPIFEQKIIVAILDEAFVNIDHACQLAERNLKNARELFDSTLNQIFSHRDDCWQTQSLAELCQIGDGNHSSKYPKKSEMLDSGVPFLRGVNIRNNKIINENILFISKLKHLTLKKGHLKKDDVLFTNRGEIGKVAIVGNEFDGANLNSQIAWLRTNGDVLAEFLFYFLQSKTMRQHFESVKSGAALQQFTIRMLKTVQVSYPIKLNVQAELVQKIKILQKNIEELEIIYKQKNIALDELKQSLLQKAFRGELTQAQTSAA